VLMRCWCRVKLPKTFLAVNLSDAFTFQEKPQSDGGDKLDVKTAENVTTSGPTETSLDAASDRV